MKKAPFILPSLIFFLLLSCGGEKKAKTTEKKEVKKIEEGVMTMTMAIAPSSAQLKWKGYKVVKSDLSSHEGTLLLKEGYLTFEKNELVGGKFIMDVSGLICSDLAEDKKKKLEDHLKSADFFDVKNYPEAIFEITDVQKKENKFQLSGNLTIKDKTNNITFDADVQKIGEKFILVVDPFDIDRQLWGVSYKSSYKDVVINNNITLEFSAETVPHNRNN